MAHLPESRQDSPRSGVLPRFPRFLPLLLLLPVLPLLGPLPDELSQPPAPHPVLLDRHGDELTDFPRPDYFRHQPASLEDIPDHLVKATLAAEDKRFFDHPGIDAPATARALYHNLRQGRVTSGASTITQQLIKISSPPVKRDLLTKAREFTLARRLETRWSKDQILTAYLNRLDYGSHRQGCAAAARHFFDKPLADLSLAEAALLAGLPQAPSRLNPFRNPEAALARRNWILDRLQSEFAYPPATIARAQDETLVLSTSTPRDPIPHLKHQVRADTRLSIDSGLQTKTGRILREELALLRDKNVQHGALVVLHNPTGEILAFHGSPDFSSRNGGQVNGALSPRSPGSALKPFTYALAFQNQGLFPGTVIADIPTDYRTAEGLDTPKNFDRRHHGPVSIRRALATSLNVAAMRLLNQLGGPEPLHALLTELGLSLPGNPVGYGLGLTIGNAEVTLLQLTNAYATLARLGAHRPITFEFQEDTAQSAPAFPLEPRACYLVADILADNQARAPAFGIRSPLRLPFRCAVKTGTSSDFRDNWCFGFTRDFTVGVWVGNFDNSPMAGLTGVSGAGPIFRRTMLALHQDQAPAFPARPSSLVTLSIDERTGHSFPVSPPANNAWHRQELVPRDQLPLPVSPTDYDDHNRALLDREYHEWFRSADNSKGHAYALGQAKAPVLRALQSLTPVPGATYYLDPELPGGSNQLSLSATLPGVTWASETLTIQDNIALLTPGTHQLTVTHPETRQTFECHFEVEEL